MSEAHEGAGFGAFTLVADEDDLAPLSEVLVDAVAAFAPWALVDLYPRPSTPGFARLPDRAKEAWEQLAVDAARRRPDARDPYFQCSFDLRDAHTRRLVGAWALYSISVDLYRTEAMDEPAALDFHDEGLVLAELSAEEELLVRDALGRVNAAETFRRVQLSQRVGFWARLLGRRR